MIDIEKPLEPPSPSVAAPPVLLLPPPRPFPRPDREEIAAELDRLQARIAVLRLRAVTLDRESPAGSNLFLRRSFEMALAPEEDLLPPVL
jgi:hypothetical protein